MTKIRLRLPGKTIQQTMSLPPKAAALLVCLLLFPLAAHASPFDSGISSIRTLFTGTIAKEAALIAIVIGDFSFASGEPGRRRTLVAWRWAAEALREALRPLYQSLATITEQVRALDRQIEKFSKERYQATTLLRSVPGVGPLTALTYVLTVADTARFASSREVGAFLGLRPRQRQSGSRNPELGIAKNGDHYLRSLLVECAHYMLSRAPDSAMKRWGLGLAQAVHLRNVELSLRLPENSLSFFIPVLLHSLWSNRELYCPFPNQPISVTT